jgi:hypothetical protein
MNVLENNYRLLMRLETMKAFFDRLLGTNLTTKKITFYMESNVGCGYYWFNTLVTTIRIKY